MLVKHNLPQSPNSTRTQSRLASGQALLSPFLLLRGKGSLQETSGVDLLRLCCKSSRESVLEKTSLGSVLLPAHYSRCCDSHTRSCLHTAAEASFLSSSACVAFGVWVWWLVRGLGPSGQAVRLPPHRQAGSLTMLLSTLCASAPWFIKGRDGNTASYETGCLIYSSAHS